MFDLRSVLDNFRSGLRSVTLVGEEDVEGETMRHYQVAMDPSEAAGEGDPRAPPTEDVPETVTYDLWFDGGRVLFRRMEADLGSRRRRADRGAVRLGQTRAPAVSGEVTGPGRSRRSPTWRTGDGLVDRIGRARGRPGLVSRSPPARDQRRAPAGERSDRSALLRTTTGQRPRMFCRMPFMLVGTGPFGSGMFGRAGVERLEPVEDVGHLGGLHRRGAW